MDFNFSEPIHSCFGKTKVQFQSFWIKYIMIDCFGCASYLNLQDLNTSLSILAELVSIEKNECRRFQ
jgi:hypothetical protein